MKYRMQATNPGTVAHNIKIWDRVAAEAGTSLQELDDLIRRAKGHEKDDGEGRPFVLYCIRNGWIKECG
jgi:hypothetical protein